MHLTQAEIASARLRSPQMTEPFLDGIDTTQVVGLRAKIAG